MERTAVLVDDHADVLKLLGQCFTEDGFTIHSANSGFELMKLVREGKLQPDVVILDFMMPDRSGLDLLSIVRSFWTKAKIIFYTAHDGPILQQLKVNADAVVSKTTSMEKLVALSNELIESA